MSSGKITRFQNNVRIDGNLDLSNSTGSLTVSSLASAPSSPTVGQSYYDSTLGKYRIYQITGWSNIDGSAAGSLDAAYNGGAEIAVDAGAVTLTDTHCYRAQWDKDLKKVIFFIDGVQGGSITTNTPTGDGDGEILLSLEATATGECYLYIFDLFTSRGI